MTPLRWSDMDAYGHVNSVQFLRLLEDARVSAFAATSTHGGGAVVDTALFVARQQIEYLAPLVYRPAPVAIDLWVTRLDVASFDLGYQVVDGTVLDGPAPVLTADRQTEPTVYAQAETTLVLFDLARDRPRRMSAAENDLLSGWRDEPIRWRHHGPGR
jgi:acyl-CoA thioester hydrolase